MATWRARHYSYTVFRRTVLITVRRFRLGKTLSRNTQRKLRTYNVKFGHIKQIAIEYKYAKPKKRTVSRTRRLQTAFASILILSGLIGVTFSAAALSKPA